MAGSINLANVALGFDASKIQKGVDLSAVEMRKLNTIFKDSISPVDKYNADLKVLEKGHKAGAISADRMAQAVASLQAKYKQAIPESKSFAMPWTELHSAIGLVTQGLHSLQSIARPVFDEMNRIDAINDQAHKLGMSYRDLNTIQLALGESSGASAEDISKAMQKLSIGVTEAIKTGKGAHADALKTLSLDAATIGGMKAVEQLEAITNAMQGIGSQSERLQLTFDLFGKSGTQLVSAFDEGGGKLAEMAKFADEVGLNLSGTVVEGINNANDSLGRLSMATQGWIAHLTGGAAPALGVIADHMAGIAKPGQGTAALGEQAGDLLQGMYAVVSDFNAIMSKPIMDVTLSDFGRTQRDLTMKTLAAQGRAEEQALDKAEKAKQIQERKGMEEDLAKAKREQDRADIEWLKDYEGWMTRQNREVERVEKEKALEEEFQRRQQKIKSEASDKLKKLNKDGDTVTENSAPSLRAGSVEAYKFMLAQKDKQAEQGERMITIQEDIKETMKRQLDELQSQARFTKAR